MAKRETLSSYEDKYKKPTLICCCVCLGAVAATPFLIDIPKGEVVVFFIAAALLAADAFIYNIQSGISIGTVPVAIAALYPASAAVAIGSSQMAVRAIAFIIVILSFLLILYFGIAFFRLAKAARPSNLPGPGDTIMVLGTKIVGDKPSPSLRRRLAKTLKIGGKTRVNLIVTGGRQGHDRYSEAYVMARYLMAHGFPVRRILKEEKATSTLENLKYGMALAHTHYPGKPVFALSSDYHLYRVKRIAGENGFDIDVIGALTGPISFLPEWCREVIIIKREGMLKKTKKTADGN